MITTNAQQEMSALLAHAEAPNQSAATMETYVQPTRALQAKDASIRQLKLPVRMEAPAPSETPAKMARALRVQSMTVSMAICAQAMNAILLRDV